MSDQDAEFPTVPAKRTYEVKESGQDFPQAFYDWSATKQYLESLDADGITWEMSIIEDTFPGEWKSDNIEKAQRHEDLLNRVRKQRDEREAPST
ncbi:MAG TPA: hypothetical protein VGM77_11200 [Gemmatimonadales bacterium]|jgi:hypothetical protein